MAAVREPPAKLTGLVARHSCRFSMSGGETKQESDTHVDSFRQVISDAGSTPAASTILPDTTLFPFRYLFS